MGAPQRQAVPLAHLKKVLDANRLPNGVELTPGQRNQLIAQYRATEAQLAAQQAAAAAAGGAPASFFSAAGHE